MERLKVACEGCLAAIGDVLQHEGARRQTVRWRFDHLRLELRSFLAAMWPRKQEQEDK